MDKALPSGAGQAVSAVPVSIPSAEQVGDFIFNWFNERDPDGMAECLAAMAVTAFSSGTAPAKPDYRHAFKAHRKWPWFCADCGYPEHESLKHFSTQGIEAGTGETEGLDAKRESPVGNADAPNTHGGGSHDR